MTTSLDYPTPDNQIQRPQSQDDALDRWLESEQEKRRERELEEFLHA